MLYVVGTALMAKFFARPPFAERKGRRPKIASWGEEERGRVAKKGVPTFMAGIPHKIKRKMPFYSVED